MLKCHCRNVASRCVHEGVAGMDAVDVRELITKS